jgi:uncharacterized Rmd1/YagE family protein
MKALLEKVLHKCCIVYWKWQVYRNKLFLQKQQVIRNRGSTQQLKHVYLYSLLELDTPSFTWPSPPLTTLNEMDSSQAKMKNMQVSTNLDNKISPSVI